MRANDSGRLRCAGRTFSEAELGVVAEVVAAGGSRSRTQLMARACERLRWRRANGALKVRECRDLFPASRRCQTAPGRVAMSRRGSMPG